MIPKPMIPTSEPTMTAWLSLKTFNKFKSPLVLRFHTNATPLHYKHLKPLASHFKPTTSKPTAFTTITTTTMSSWTCKTCTYINSPTTHKSPTCQICLSKQTVGPTSSPSTNNEEDEAKWSCKACTFLNSYKNSSCEICDTRAPVSSISSSASDYLNDVETGSVGVGNVFLPLQRCKRKKSDDEDCVVAEGGDKGKQKVVHFDSSQDNSKSDSAANGHKSGSLQKDSKTDCALSSLKILSYNVWFREDLELYKRMKALGDLILLHSPDIICFQEVTPNIYDLFKHSNWWKAYRCSVTDDIAKMRPYFCMQLSRLPVKSFSCKPFENSIMGRELCLVEVEVQGLGPLVVATSHLESPSPAPPKWDQMYSKERVQQAKEALNVLKKYPNVIFCGDMNWNEKMDGNFPLPSGWVDAWVELRPGENGWTYDTKSNQMLSGNRTLQKRLDRFICNLYDYKISGIDMIGMEAISGVTYCKEKKLKNEIKKLVLPVLPSDHYGLLMTISTL